MVKLVDETVLRWMTDDAVRRVLIIDYCTKECNWCNARGDMQLVVWMEYDYLSSDVSEKMPFVGGVCGGCVERVRSGMALILELPHSDHDEVLLVLRGLLTVRGVLGT